MLSFRSISIALLLMVLSPADIKAGEPGRHQLLQQRRYLRYLTEETDRPLEFDAGTLGICQLYNLSGYLAFDAAGHVIPLSQYCQQQRNWVWYETSSFWQQFRQVATAETIAFTQTLNPNDVEAYAQSICPFLTSSGTQQELEQIQTDQQLPIAFEQTVTIAATKTYCRQYRATR